MRDELNIFTHREIDENISDGVAIKDNILVEGMPATASSKVLDGFVAPYDATVVKRLRAGGKVFVGKTNLDEFAMGSSTESSAFGVTKNPWDVSRVPGGSSGGSAAAVAAGLCAVALGSDTGGSIRQPAAFCGVTGLKPTYGTVSRYGLIALASSLDVIGPIARDAKKVEETFELISGRDEMDQTTIEYKYKSDDRSLSELKIALPKELWELEIDDAVKSAANQTVELLRSKGATVETVTMPIIKHALAAYYIIMPAEASSNLARYDGIRFRSSAETKNLLELFIQTRSNGFGPEVKRRVLLGTYVLSHGHYDAYYAKAIAVKRAIDKSYAQVFENYDLIFSPTTPTPAFKIGEKVSDPLEMYKSDLLTVSANLAGVPSLSLPIGFSENVPIGGQFTAKKTADATVISVAKQLQELTEWHTKKPSMWYGEGV